MSGLLKLQHAANNQAALEDFNNLRAVLTEQGRADLMPELPEKHGWRRLDALTRKTIQAALAQGVTIPLKYGATDFTYLSEVGK